MGGSAIVRWGNLWGNPHGEIKNSPGDMLETGGASEKNFS